MTKFVIIAKQKGLWKFYAFVSNQEILNSELAHLKDQETESKVYPIQYFDMDKIKDIENTLNG